MTKPTKEPVFTSLTEGVFNYGMDEMRGMMFHRPNGTVMAVNASWVKSRGLCRNPTLREVATWARDIADQLAAEVKKLDEEKTE